jgi:hypothetical protein
MALLGLTAPAALAAPLSPLGYAVLGLANRAALDAAAANAAGPTGNQDQDLDFHGFGDNDDSGEDLSKE